MSNAKKLGIFAGVLLLLVGLWFYRKIQAAAKLGFTVGSPTNFHVDWQGGFVTWLQNINVTNGDTVSIQLNAASLDIYANTTSYLGKATLPAPIDIAPQGRTNIQVLVTIGTGDLLFALPDVISSATQHSNESLTLNGTISAIGATIPIKQTFTFDFSKFL